MGMYFYGLYRIHHIGYKMAQGHLWRRGGGSRLGGSREEGRIHRGRRVEWSVKGRNGWEGKVWDIRGKEGELNGWERRKVVKNLAREI